MICQCKNCKRQIDISDDKIPNCGWPLNWHCSECGSVNRISWHRKALQNSSMTKLEWSEEQQVFHYNSAGSRAMENSNGFETIMECADDGEASLFAHFLSVQYIHRGIKLTTKEAVFTLFNLDQLLKKIKPAGATR